MILADKIIELRKKNGLSQEELAEKLNVSRQSISKWEGAQSIPDMNKILKLSDLFSVSTDYLLKDEIEEMETQVPIEDHDSSVREASVSMEEANAYLAYKSRIATPMAFAVLLFIVSAAPLIALQALQEGGKLPLSENQAGGIGVI
ncbi:MAG: helix-turn-helix transcriptional regulator, partial [Lachnospiraceae bacterium]|nr:helix-turn-helix transcriptional regulator [Lachnospiraceae bacterium]